MYGVILDAFIKACREKSIRNIDIVVAGAGAYLARLCSVPGASDVISGFRYINKYESDIEISKFVSEEFVELLLKESACVSKNNDLTKIRITGSLLTNRKQRSENRVYVLTNTRLNDTISYNLDLIKFKKPADYDRLSESVIAMIREQQDLIVSFMALSRYMDDRTKEIVQSVAIRLEAYQTFDCVEEIYGSGNENCSK